MSESTLLLAPDRYTGRRLGKYEVICRLSSGGMSEIFLAFQRGLAGFRKLVVLKQILPDIQGEEDIVRMFLNEAKITAAFNHPNIAQVFDLDVADDELFLAMEFVPGATLIEVARACRLADEPIPLGFTMAVARDTAQALHYAHTFKDPLGRSRQVIHRDVAEKNIMVTYAGVTKLLDFGIAKAQGRDGRTAAGKVKGTSGYMSPEQIMGDALDSRSDVFSLGVVLHECFTGMRLFYGKDAEEGMKAALEFQPPPPSHLNPDVSPLLDAVVMKALARDRKDRFASALEVARALERASAGTALWLPEQCGELMQRFFADRQEQTRRLLEGSGLAENSGEILIPRRRSELEIETDPGGGRQEPKAESPVNRVVRAEPLSPTPRKSASPGSPGVLPPPGMVPTSLNPPGTGRGGQVARPAKAEVTVIAHAPQPSPRVEEVMDVENRGTGNQDAHDGDQGKAKPGSRDRTHTGPLPARPLDDAPEVTDPVMNSPAPALGGGEAVAATNPGHTLDDQNRRRRNLAMLLGLCGGLLLGFLALLRFLKRF